MTLILLLLSFLFWNLAPMCSAGMDTLTHHLSLSIWQDKNMYDYDPAFSWDKKYVNRDKAQGHVKWHIPLPIAGPDGPYVFVMNKPDGLTDPWHKFKSGMIWSLCISAALILISTFFGPPPVLNFCLHPGWNAFFNFVIYLSIFGTSWNVNFSLFYKRIFIRTKKTA